MNDNSFRHMKQIRQDLLQSRMETVKELKESNTESYSIVKDHETGEHYIHYVYLHIDVAGSGEEEYFHQFLPVSSDDVLGILFENNAYDYPAYWREPFMRGGPNREFVWFDPIGLNDYEQMEAVGQELAERIRKFKEKGAFDNDSIRQLFDDVDRL